MPSGIKLKKKKRNGNKIVPDSTGSCFPSVFKRGNLWPKCGKRLTNYKKSNNNHTKKIIITITDIVQYTCYANFFFHLTSSAQHVPKAVK